MKTIDRDAIIRLTEEYGGRWGINHTRRLLQLIAIIGEGLTYDADVLWIAAHLHDWGAYPPWAIDGVDHALRSTQVAHMFLMEQDCPPDLIQPIVDCIGFHHQAGVHPRIEAILLRDADALDFLGVVGILRDFSKTPRDLRKAYEIVQRRRATLPHMLHLEQAKAIAADRIQRMDAVLAAFTDETFGNF
jgi:uncharacterized protein